MLVAQDASVRLGLHWVALGNLVAKLKAASL
jgi:hypothetical protein